MSISVPRLERFGLKRTFMNAIGMSALRQKHLTVAAVSVGCFAFVTSADEELALVSVSLLDHQSQVLLP